MAQDSTLGSQLVPWLIFNQEVQLSVLREILKDEPSLPHVLIFLPQEYPSGTVVVDGKHDPIYKTLASNISGTLSSASVSLSNTSVSPMFSCHSCDGRFPSCVLFPRFGEISLPPRHSLLTAQVSAQISLALGNRGAYQIRSFF